MYAKLFASLYQGTLRGRSDEILVFTNLLAHTSAGGIVDKHFRAIADETGLSVDRVKSAIETLESPDPESRSPEHGGARIVRMDDHRAWGWIVVNYEKYRSIKSEADRAEQNRLAQQRWRDRQKAQKEADRNAGVSNDKQDKPKEKQKEKNLSPLPLSQTPPVEPPLTDEERERMNFVPEPPPQQLRDWGVDYSPTGKPALIEKCISAYPTLAGRPQQARNYLVPKTEDELFSILAAVSDLRQFYEKLPSDQKQFLPAIQNYFENEQYLVTPHQIFRTAPKPKPANEYAKYGVRRGAI